MVACDLIEPFQIVGILDVHKLGHGQADHEHLPDFFFERELLERLLRPFFAIMIKMDRRSALKLTGCHRRGQSQQTDAGEHQLFHHGATIPEMPRPVGGNLQHLGTAPRVRLQALTLQALPSC